MKRKPKIYIAGPMYSSGDMDDNIRKALSAAHIIKEGGGIPIIPHLYFFWNLMELHPRQFWLDLDEDWVKQEANALYRIDGASEGGDLEEGWAAEVEIPVFVRLTWVLDFIKNFKGAKNNPSYNPPGINLV